MSTTKVKTPVLTLGLGSFATPAPTTAARDKKDTILVDAATAKHVDAFVKAKADLDEATARAAVHGAKLKEFGRDHLVKSIQEGKSAESVILASPKSGALYIPTDRFTQIKDDTLETVREVLGEEHVQATTLYTFDPELVARYGAQITKALQQLAIPAEEKTKLLTAKTVYSYTFGLDEVGAVAKKKGIAVSTVLETVGVVEQLKVRGASSKK